jgi:hypothetical protein
MRRENCVTSMRANERSRFEMAGRVVTASILALARFLLQALIGDEELRLAATQHGADAVGRRELVLECTATFPPVPRFVKFSSTVSAEPQLIDRDSVSPERQTLHDRLTVRVRLERLRDVIRLADEHDSTSNGQTGRVQNRYPQLSARALAELRRGDEHCDKRRPHVIEAV